MSQREENSNTLYIPINIKTRFEFVAGFGFTELAITAVAAAISIFISIISNVFSQDVFKGVLVVLITASASGMTVRKNDFNQSMKDIIGLFFRFTNTQQKFKYQYHNKYIGRTDEH